MIISKANWNTDGDNLRLSMPLTKVDKERRIVSGFASLDNIDKQDDIVTAEASMEAFAKFRGNIREMHQPLAVGKMVDFKAEKYFDPESKKFYNGVFVSAYVSKGAQDTWEKVLDGTLAGFSIGGRMNKWDDGFDEKSDKAIRIIKQYDLVELSLVDSPANQFANIVSVEKVDGVNIFKGDETVLENVFYDKANGIVLASENESELSPITGEQMENIGFVEKTDNEKLNMIKFLVDSAKGINTSKINKEENLMAKSTKNTVEEIVEKSDIVVEAVEVAPEADAKADAVIAETETEKADKPKTDEENAAEDSKDSTEKAAKPMTDEEESAAMIAAETPADEEAEAKKPKASKSDEVIEGSVSETNDGLEKAFSDLVEVVKSLQTEVELLKSTKVDIEVAQVSFEAVAKDIATATNTFNEFGKRVELVEQDTAFRKSGDLGEIVQNQPETVEKSLWGGSFLKTADLFN
jgi:ParB-like chromosome segregation protein Spo0J